MQSCVANFAHADNPCGFYSLSTKTSKQHMRYMQHSRETRCFNSKNNLRGITLGMRPIWGIQSLSLILSWPGGGGGGGVLPYMGYIGMCGPKGYGFSAVLVINRVSIIAILPPLWS